jgi:pimeloyl-ACP methyl ester carboxylesterase
MVDVGEGLPLVLMHGTLFDHTMFAPQYEDLSDEFRVVAFDFRSREESLASPYDLDVLVSDCVRVLDDLEIETGVIGGMSLGAFVALRVAIRHPDRVRGAVLIGGQAGSFAADDIDGWAAHYASRRGETVGTEFARAECDTNFYAAVRERQPDLVRSWGERFAQRSGESMYHEVQSWLHMSDERDQLPHLTAPTLVVHGDHDAAIPVAAAVETYDALPDAELLVLPRTGHAANLERPAEVNAAIRDLMRRVQQQAG